MVQVTFSKTKTDNTKKKKSPLKSIFLLYGKGRVEKQS